MIGESYGRAGLQHITMPSPSKKTAPQSTWRANARAMAPVKKKVDPMEVEDKSDALTCAAMQGNTEAIRALLEQGASANAKDAIGVAPLHWGAFCGHAGVCDALIGSGAEVHSRDQEGRTPLHVAAYESHTEVLKRLLLAGADVAAPDKMGWTPLHCAVSNDQGAACRLLTEAKADPLVKDFEGKTPMDLAKHFENQALVGILEGAQDQAEVLDLMSLGIGDRLSSHRGSKTSPTSITQSPQPVS